MRPEAEEARVRYLYRHLIVRGKLRLPLRAAVELVGPDCAYHLYRDYAAKSRWCNASAVSGFELETTPASTSGQE